MDRINKNKKPHNHHNKDSFSLDAVTIVKPVIYAVTIVMLCTQFMLLPKQSINKPTPTQTFNIKINFPKFFLNPNYSYFPQFEHI